MPETEKRAAPRFPVTADTECEFAVPLLTDLGSVRIVNLSMSGIGLLFREKVEVGAILAIGLRNAPKGFNRVHLVHVAHVTARHDGYYVVGGALDPPLTYQEFTMLVT